MKNISLGIGNTYGTVEAWEHDGNYFIGLNDWCGLDMQPISKELYEAIVKEFGPDETKRA
jgi:hypothetical protein